jgi:hypothetical protein
MTLKRRVGAVAVAGAMATTGLVAMTTSAAQATPSGCSISYVGSPHYKASAKCTSGTGTYRIKVVCTDELRGSSGTYYGATVGIGGTSSVTCPYQGGVQWQVTSASIQFL